MNLVYCHITSPIDGPRGPAAGGSRQYRAGEQHNALVVVTQLQPITVIFSVAEDYLPQIQRQLRQGQRLAVDAFDREQAEKDCARLASDSGQSD